MVVASCNMVKLGSRASCLFSWFIRSHSGATLVHNIACTAVSAFVCGAIRLDNAKRYALGVVRLEGEDLAPAAVARAVGA